MNNPNYIHKIPPADNNKADTIIINACQHFNCDSLLTEKRRGCMISNAVMYAVYKEAYHRHRLASGLFGYTFPQQSFRAMLKIEKCIRRNKKEAGLILDFYRKYGYCKHLWEVKKAA